MPWGEKNVFFLKEKGIKLSFSLARKELSCPHPPPPKEKKINCLGGAIFLEDVSF
jgi:hypothetical protein